MYLYVVDKRKNQTLVNLEVADGIKYDVSDHIISASTYSTTGSKYYKDVEEGAARFKDIIKAEVSGKVRVYDMQKPIGYWEPKPKAAQKAAPKE